MKRNKETIEIKDRRKPGRKSKSGKAIALVLVTAALLAVVLVAKNSIYSEINADASYSDYQLSDFIRYSLPGQSLVSDLSEIETGKVADYDIKIKVLGIPFTCKLHLGDSTAPRLSYDKEKTVFSTQEVTPETFINEIDDSTAVTLTFAEDYDFTATAKCSVKIVAVDEGGNEAYATIQVTVIDDKVPPIIEGVQEIWVAVGSTASYKRYISVIDDYDENPVLEIDTSAVNLSVEGSYPITYTAKDAAGNIAVEKTTVNVTTSPVDLATEDEVNAKADEILAKILKPGMSDYEKSEAIFWWIYENVTYLEGTPKDTWVKGAYRGLFNNRGDCSVNQATAKCLLTRAGIKNMEINRNMDIGGYNHYWNLVDFGDGWRHFDTMDNVFHVPIFGWTSEQINSWAPEHWNMHHYYDKDYPGILQSDNSGKGTYYYVEQELTTAADEENNSAE